MRRRQDLRHCRRHRPAARCSVRPRGQEKLSPPRENPVRRLRRRHRHRRRRRRRRRRLHRLSCSSSRRRLPASSPSSSSSSSSTIASPVSRHARSTTGSGGGRIPFVTGSGGRIPFVLAERREDPYPNVDPTTTIPTTRLLPLGQFLTFLDVATPDRLRRRRRLPSPPGSHPRQRDRRLFRGGGIPPDQGMRRHRRRRDEGYRRCQRCRRHHARAP
jgi:hypothetical protein